MQYGMMHRALVMTNTSPDLPRPLQDCHVGCFYHVLSVMEERSEDFREALSNIARQARSLLQNFNDSNVQPIEQRMLDQRPRESGILSTRTPSSSQTVNVNNTSIRNVESTAVAAQLRNLFPTVGKRSFGGKSSNSKCVKGKKPPAKKAKKDVVHKDVVLLPSPDTKSVPTHQTRCRLENNGFVVHAFPVDKSLQEEDLRAQIRELFPPLAETDFEFVKSCYGQIITPKLATGVHFSASRVLGLAGQGSIYIRPECDISASLNSDTDSPPQSPDHDPRGGNPSPSSPLPEQVEIADDGECSGLSNVSYLSTTALSSSAINRGGLDQLKDMFPGKSTSILQNALTCHGSVSRAALFLSSQNLPFESDIGEDDDDSLLEPVFSPANEKADSLDTVLKELQKGLSTQKEKLKVDEEDLFNDAMAYYKDPSFDPTKRLRVLYTGQPAVDTGGVTRHFFSQLLQVISQMFFQGTNYKSPIYNADIVASGMMKYIGTIIVHSILQGGPDFPVFSPSVYRYLATGDVDTAMDSLNYGDCSEPVKNFIDKVLYMYLCLHTNSNVLSLPFLSSLLFK